MPLWYNRDIRQRGGVEPVWAPPPGTSGSKGDKTMAKIGTLNRIAPATLTGPKILTIKEARAARRQREIQINMVEVINASTIVKKTLGEPSTQTIRSMSQRSVDGPMRVIRRSSSIEFPLSRSEPLSRAVCVES